MNHTDFPVIIYDNDGQQIGTKKRKDVDKFVDIIECVEVLIFTPEKKLILSRILNKPTEVYAGKLAAPVATIRREGEEEIVSAKRALRDELFVENVELTFLGRNFVTMESGIKKWLTVFFCTADIDVKKFNSERNDGLSIYSLNEIEKIILGDAAETFKKIWIGYKDKFC